MYTLPSPIGNLGITLHQNKLFHIKFLANHTLSTDFSNNSLLKKIYFDLQSYFKNPFHQFSVPILIEGSTFQQKVWDALQRIPVGKTVSYGELANQLQTSPRAIGNACRANPIPLIIPCHRIIAKNNLGGFSGTTAGPLFEIKKWLLQHESLNAGLG